MTPVQQLVTNEFAAGSGTGTAVGFNAVIQAVTGREAER
jgi:hypothetical protein